MKNSQFLDPQVLARIDNLELLVGCVVVALAVAELKLVEEKR